MLPDNKYHRVKNMRSVMATKIDETSYPVKLAHPLATRMVEITPEEPVDAEYADAFDFQHAGLFAKGSGVDKFMTACIEAAVVPIETSRNTLTGQLQPKHRWGGCLQILDGSGTAADWKDMVSDTIEVRLDVFSGFSVFDLRSYLRFAICSLRFAICDV